MVTLALLLPFIGRWPILIVDNEPDVVDGCKGVGVGEAGAGARVGGIGVPVGGTGVLVDMGVGVDVGAMVAVGMKIIRFCNGILRDTGEGEVCCV